MSAVDALENGHRARAGEDVPGAVREVRAVVVLGGQEAGEGGEDEGVSGEEDARGGEEATPEVWGEEDSEGEDRVGDDDGTWATRAVQNVSTLKAPDLQSPGGPTLRGSSRARV